MPEDNIPASLEFGFAMGQRVRHSLPSCTVVYRGGKKSKPIKNLTTFDAEMDRAIQHGLLREGDGLRVTLRNEFRRRMAADTEEADSGTKAPVLAVNPASGTTPRADTDPVEPVGPVGPFGEPFDPDEVLW